MARTGKVKQDSSSNPRSRASKRATSPSINTDKSLKEAPRASGATPMLSARPNSGIFKSSRKQKNMKRGQRARQEKGLARAESVMDQLAQKLDSAQARLKKRNARKALWNDVNDATKEEQRKATGISILGNTGKDEDEEGRHNEEDVSMSNGQTEPKVVGSTNGPTAVPIPSSNANGSILHSREEVDDEAYKIT